MTDRVQAKVALVTGAARGLGRASAVALARERADVVAVDLCGPLPAPYPGATPEDLEETAAQVRAAGRRVVPVRADVRDADVLGAAIDAAVEELGRLDIVVAAAGVCSPRGWADITEAEFRATMDINVVGVWNTVTAAAPHVVRGGAGGAIVIVSSAAGIKVQPFMAHYTTSKWAVRGMAKAFAVELARHDIRVNSLHPAGMATGMTAPEMHDHLGAAMQDDPRLGGMFTNLLPTAVTQPEEVAATVVFLASDDARWVTAHEIAPDAGVTEF